VTWRDAPCSVSGSALSVPRVSRSGAQLTESVAKLGVYRAVHALPCKARDELAAIKKNQVAEVRKQ
jgi:hypothetical protein